MDDARVAPVVAAAAVLAAAIALRCCSRSGGDESDVVHATRESAPAASRAHVLDAPGAQQPEPYRDDDRTQHDLLLHVRGPENAEIAGAELWTEESDGAAHAFDARTEPRRIATTDRYGTARLDRSDVHVIRVRARGYADRVVRLAEERPDDRDGGAAAEPIEVTLARAAALRGVVETPWGARVEGAIVVGSVRSGPTEYDVTATSDRSGEFTLAGVATPADVVVRVSGDAYAAAGRVELSVPRDAGVVTLVALPVYAASFAAVDDTDGSAIPRLGSVDVTWTTAWLTRRQPDRDGPVAGTVSRRVVVGVPRPPARGASRWPIPPADSGEVLVHIRPPGYAPMEFALPLVNVARHGVPATTTVRLTRLAPGFGRLELRPRESALADGTVRLRVRGEDWEFETTVTGPAWGIDAVPAGPVTILDGDAAAARAVRLVRADGPLRLQQPVAIEVRDAGTSYVDVDLERCARDGDAALLEVEVVGPDGRPDPLAAVSVFALGATGGGFARAGGGGDPAAPWQFEVQPGLLKVAATRSGFAGAAEEVRLDAGETRRVRLRLLDASGR